MKKLICGLMMTMTILLMTTVAMAEGELPTEPFSWEQLGTIAGATLATLLIVQLLKLPLDRVWRIPTRIIAYVIALVIMIVATHFTIGLTWSNACLAVINAVIVALAAMGAYEVTFRKLEEQKRLNAQANQDHMEGMDV